MRNQIIYQTQQEQPQTEPSLLARLCSCLYYFRKKNVIANEKYQLGIDTPKSHSNRKVCVLDLDETLVHSQFKGDNGFDFQLEILVQTQLFKVFVTIRPGAEAFIDTLSEYFDIVLWTASLKEYADPVMDVIDPQRKAQTRLYRESCTPLKGGLAKNLNKLGRDLKEVLIIDNSSMSFMLQPENGFLIKDFIFDKTDTELETIMPFLIWLSQQHDVRPVALLYQTFNEENTQRKNAKKQILSQSVVLNSKSSSNIQIARTHTINQCDLEDAVLRDEAGVNSPNNEMKLEEQTDDDDEKETFEISN